jgi:uncharacterized protein YecE (DUF72 family)
MGRIRIGLSSWTDKSLLESGKFYPHGLDDAESRLKYYTSQFPDLVEVNSTYYAPPSERNAILWVERTPDDFMFDVKMFSLFTQHPTRPSSLPQRIYQQLDEEVKSKDRIYLNHIAEDAAEEIMAGFVGALEPLHASGKLGAILLQFPHWFHPGQRSMEHIRWCKQRLADYRVAVEFRNSRWLEAGERDKSLAFLKSNDLAYVCVDEPQGHKSSVPPIAETTSPDLAYVRFHGRRRETWEKSGMTVQERFKYLYNREELQEWVPKIRDLAEDAAEVHVLLNTNYEDYAVRSARQLKGLLDMKFNGSN